MSAKKAFFGDGGRYALHVPDYGIVFNLDRLRRERHELIGELAVRADLAGAITVAGNVLHISDFNLSSARARQDRARLLAQRSRAQDLDWFAYLEELCNSVIEAERGGTPTEWLPDVPRPTDDDMLRFAGFALPRHHAGILFGDGGAMKSLLALWIAGTLTRAGLTVLYADWELTAGEHRVRLDQLFGDDLPRVGYQRCERPLTVEVDGLRRRVRDHGIDYLVLDSVAVGCNGPPESAEVAAEFMRALRQIGVGTLCLAHVSKADDGDRKPFGSAFWHNLARATWHIKRSEPTASDATVELCITPRKANLGPLGLPFAFRVSFSDGQTTIRAIDAATVDDFAPKLPLWQRMRAALKREGAMTAVALAELLGEDAKAVYKAAERDQGRAFVRFDGPDGVSRIGAKER